MDAFQLVENIDNKIQQLAAELKLLRQKNAVLINENKQLKTDLESKEAVVGELKYKLSNTQRGFEEQRGVGTDNSEELKKQIDQYIKEIDKCIEWLQNS